MVPMINNTKKCHKKIIQLCFLVILVFLIGNLSGCMRTDDTTIKVSGAFALYPLMTKWAAEYQLLNPGIKIDIQTGGAGKGMTDALTGIVDIGMVSREIHQTEINQGAFWISVVKDAVVATVNTNNPVIDQIQSQGVTRQRFIDIFITRNITTWGQLVGDPSITDPIKVYTRSDSCGAAETWAAFLGDYLQDDLTNNADAAIHGDDQLVGVVKSDRVGIGYNNINYVYNIETKLPYPGIYPVPLDINNDGVLDENERFYENLTSLMNAITNNIYPSPPARPLHLVTKQNFTGNTKDFIRWILTDGQQYVAENGYIYLSAETINQELIYLETGQRPEIR